MRAFFASYTLPPFLSQLCRYKYARTEIEGWEVLIRRELIRRNQEIVEDASHLLTVKLQEIKTAIPAQHHSFLTQIKFWIEESNPDFSGMVYHPSAKWLQNHGYNPLKAKAIEIANIQNFITWDSIQPWHVLHELTHAYHHQVITHDFQPLIQAYEYAKEQGLYQRVPRNNGKITTAYALGNVKEYFAELSEAYFGENDFFPFNREQLRGYDTRGYSAVEAAWDILATEE
ncbi:hypothetical protein [Acaryochloris sp. IP29b_bin.148]|uniref:hypothetical protein n=1 Tax=Acaryochloris sp. IP29b_bin.148 TaxID=2969218 RepID=UPI002636AA2B|nr:hypothetical protein [Acaryochloris sp. IP29b_bin.148]